MDDLARSYLNHIGELQEERAVLKLAVSRLSVALEQERTLHAACLTERDALWEALRPFAEGLVTYRDPNWRAVVCRFSDVEAARALLTPREPQPPAPIHIDCMEFTGMEEANRQLNEGLKPGHTPVQFDQPPAPQPAAEGPIKGPVTVEKVPGLGLQLLDRGLCVNMNSKAALNQIAAALNAQPAVDGGGEANPGCSWGMPGCDCIKLTKERNAARLRGERDGD